MTESSWRRDARGEYTSDEMGRRVRLITVEEFERIEAGSDAAAEHNRKALEHFRNKKGKQSGKATEKSTSTRRT